MKKILEDIFDIGKTIVFVVLIAFFIRYFIFQPFVVDGYSMEPNFTDKEYLLVNKVTYRVGHPARGDVIVFDSPVDPGTDYIKRIIGLPGEKITIKNNSIYINDNSIDEKYLTPEINTYIQGDKSTKYEVTLGKDQYFVLGDNREHSSDSRVFGVLDKNKIIGKAWFIVYPWNIFGLVGHPSY